MQNQRKIDDAFIHEATTNMAYIYKDQAKQHITAFLNAEPSFRPFDAVRQNNGAIISFIELRGFIEVGKNYSHQMVIGVPRNFPQGPPIFLMSVNRSLFTINREQQLLTNKEITLEKDETGTEFIKFNFPFLTIAYKPMTSLLQIFTQLKTVINSPPLLIEIQSSRNNNNNTQNKGHLIGGNRPNPHNNVFQPNASNLNPASLTQLIDSKSIELSNTLSTLQEIEQQKDKFEYLKSRNDYLLNEHLKQLESNLSNKSKQVQNQTQQLNKLKQKSEEKGSFDDFLAISQKDELKLQQMAERQALKQAEKKVKETLQTALEHGKKYSDYKKLVRTLFAQMYQNNTKILQSAE